MDTREKRELALRERVLRGAERWSRNTRDLKPLQIGQKVLVQNQHGAGKISKKWDRTGQVIEDLGYNKYRIRVDGSGRVSDRNRQFLRQITPATPSLPGPSPGPSCHDTAPAESPVLPPVQPPVQLPVQPPVQPLAQPPVQQPVLPPLLPPVQPLVLPPVQPQLPPTQGPAPVTVDIESQPEAREPPHSEPEPGHADSEPVPRELPPEQPARTSPVPLRRSKRSNLGIPRDRLNL